MKYFISYWITLENGQGVGNAIVPVNTPIDSEEKLRATEGWIFDRTKNKFPGLKSISIINFFPFGK